MYVLLGGKIIFLSFFIFCISPSHSIHTCCHNAPNKSCAFRYILGTRLFGNSDDANADGEVAVEGAGTTAQVAVSASPATTSSLRSRFVGQGYKQVKAKLD